MGYVKLSQTNKSKPHPSLDKERSSHVSVLMFAGGLMMSVFFSTVCNLRDCDSSQQYLHQFKPDKNPSVEKGKWAQ